MSAMGAKEWEDRASDAALKAVIFYDDPDFAGHATTLLERAAARADGGLKWDVKIWRLDVLQQPDLAAVTAAIAADADLIVVAADTADPAPKVLLDWLERWARRRKIADAALMALCPEGKAAPPASWNLLKGFAAQWGLNFLDHRGSGPEYLDFVPPLPPRERAVPVALGSIGKNPPPVRQDWGLNE